MKHVRGVVIFKPQEVTIFEVGQKLIRGGKETDIVVTDITVGIFGRVKISLSDGVAIFFYNTPITFEV